MKRRQDTAKPLPVGFFLGLCASLAITLSGSAIAAHLISTEKLETEQIGYVSLIILILSAAVGSIIAKRAVRIKPLSVCAGMAGIYYLSLLAITALFFGGQYQGMGVTAICVLIGSGIAFLLTAAKKGNGKKHRKISAYR